jgi:RNA polymerase sigma-70 factor (ECF subfamily)
MSEWPSTRPSLLVRLRDPRDERAWAEFLEIYTPLVYRLARQKGLQDADADDLAQEVFRAVAGAIDRWNPDPGRGSFRGWLFRIARNLLVNLLARQGRQPRGTGDVEIARLLEEQPAPSGEASSLFALEYRRQLFHWAAEQVRAEVQPSTWDAFWRTGVREETPKDVAESLAMTVGAVYVAKNRVMAKIRQKIEQVEGD